ncbi:U5 small nuclear ribonucleo 40 kDa [Olea europaea subsp. europaea]|uniref:U5 small nuclear ribonucleo 40 kDa n=2 Tax=Olea europaea subsp. europaea TaxID=158383 RepID=A0A8S0T5H9_OLEEU|nr:U5 small nuclear ribonucleo 40 kDa [Olea europaea subsp. europaea]
MYFSKNQTLEAHTFGPYLISGNCNFSLSYFTQTLQPAFSSRELSGRTLNQFFTSKKAEVRMQVESSLSVVGPRPTELSTMIHSGGPPVPGPNGKQRTSSLESPIMLLTGHQSAVYSMKFNPAGTVVASGSHDKEIFLWNVHGDCKNFMVLKGHKNAVLEVQWTTDGTQIISASPDKTLRAWDVETGKQIKKMMEHSSFVNSCCPARRGPPLIVSGSDDGTAKLWDMRQRGSIQNFPDKYQITAVSFSDASDKIYTGGIDNDVKVWDIRRSEVIMKLQGHQDMLTGMQLSPDGSYLLTNSMDNTLRIWDMRPYAPQNRCVKILEGHQHNFEKNLLKCGWSPDGSKVTAGSSDRMVHIWDTTSRRILYKLPGHTGSVNECVFHPSEPIIGSCSSDKQIYLGEI